MTSDPASAAPRPAPTEDELRGAGDRIAQLLEDVRGMVGPTAWQRVEELVQRLLELYGAGLERVLSHAVEVERVPGSLAGRLREDELVSSLLVLHGLHPSSTAERVERAVEEARARLGTHEIEVLGLDADGTVHLRATADPRSCASSGPSVAKAIERTIVEAAPEVTRVEIDGLEAPRQPSERLVQLRPPSSGAVP
ncbi:MAG TPA: NifU family protein [Anaeromyxobacteraceae bacterium]|nr:NifU family protein [Anaeromyxobacteraceae bacterium]